VIRIHVDEKNGLHGQKYWFIKSNSYDSITIACVKQDEYGVTVRLLPINSELGIAEAEGYRDGVVRAIEIAKALKGTTQ
jgi:hypothetical protein